MCMIPKNYGPCYIHWGINRLRIRNRRISSCATPVPSATRPRKSVQFLGRFARNKQKNPHLITVMAGCVAQQEGKRAFQRLPHLDLVLGTQAFSRFNRHIEALKSGQRRIVDTEPSDVILKPSPTARHLRKTRCRNLSPSCRGVIILHLLRGPVCPGQGKKPVLAVHCPGD